MQRADLQRLVEQTGCLVCGQSCAPELLCHDCKDAHYMQIALPFFLAHTFPTDPDVRAVLMLKDLWDPTSPFVIGGLRDAEGRAITVEWGEPGIDGYYTPTFKTDPVTEAERTDIAITKALKEAAKR